MNENANKYALAALKDRGAIIAGEIFSLRMPPRSGSPLTAARFCPHTLGLASASEFPPPEPEHRRGNIPTTDDDGIDAQGDKEGRAAARSPIARLT